MATTKPAKKPTKPRAKKDPVPTDVPVAKKAVPKKKEDNPTSDVVHQTILHILDVQGSHTKELKRVNDRITDVQVKFENDDQYFNRMANQAITEKVTDSANTINARMSKTNLINVISLVLASVAFIVACLK